MSFGPTEVQPVAPGHIYGDPVPEPQPNQYLKCVRCREEDRQCLLESGQRHCMACSLVGGTCVFMHFTEQTPHRLWYLSMATRIIRMETKVRDIRRFCDYQDVLGIEIYGTLHIRRFGAVVEMSSVSFSHEDKAVVLDEVTKLESLIMNLPPFLPTTFKPPSPRENAFRLDMLARLNSQLRRLQIAYPDIVDKLCEHAGLHLKPGEPRPDVATIRELYQPYISSLEEFDKELEEYETTPQFAIKHGIPPYTFSSVHPAFLGNFYHKGGNFDASETDAYINEICPLPFSNNTTRNERGVGSGPRVDGRYLDPGLY